MTNKATQKVTITVSDGELLRKVQQMAEYIDAHPEGVACPFVDLALEIGELDAKDCFEFKGKDGGLVAEPAGNLRRLIDEFDKIKASQSGGGVAT